MSESIRTALVDQYLEDGIGDLKAEAIASLEQAFRRMSTDQMLHHSRPMAIAYLALTKEAANE